MNVARLTASAEACIEVMHLPEENEDAIRECIAKYSLPDTFFEIFTWVLHRIWNAVKSIFGASDWQKAKTLLQDRFLEMSFERGMIQENPQNFVETEIKKQVAHTADLVAEELLSLCLLSNEKDPALSDALQGSISNVGLERVVVDLAGRIDGIRAELLRRNNG